MIEEHNNYYLVNTPEPEASGPLWRRQLPSLSQFRHWQHSTILGGSKALYPAQRPATSHTLGDATQIARKKVDGEYLRSAFDPTILEFSRTCANYPPVAYRVSHVQKVERAQDARRLLAPWEFDATRMDCVGDQHIDFCGRTAVAIHFLGDKDKIPETRRKRVPIVQQIAFRRKIPSRHLQQEGS